jgi:hypothetical protein
MPPSPSCARSPAADAVAYLSRKDTPDQTPDEANAEFGAIKIVEDEIAKIRITDLEIKP